jgi:ABC-2 type transport system permease protein
MAPFETALRRANPLMSPTPSSTYSPRRVAALLLRHWYLLRSSWPRLAELIYWPAVQMFTWGFLQLYIEENASFFAHASGLFIGAVLLWNILFSSQLGFSLSFLEEVHSRNLGNLLMSPLRTGELITALMMVSIVKLAIGIVPVGLLAVAFFGLKLYGLGLALTAFFANLILTSWSVGLVVSGLVLRNGLGARTFMFGIMFMLLPMTCVYYPVAVLPEFLRDIAWMLPPTYVFEGMRALLIEHIFRSELMLEALALNSVFMAAAVVAFLRLIDSAREHGSLLQMGE